jgi:hypothetical protein
MRGFFNLIRALSSAEFAKPSEARATGSIVRYKLTADR